MAAGVLAWHSQGAAPPQASYLALRRRREKLEREQSCVSLFSIEAFFFLNEHYNSSRRSQFGLCGGAGAELG